MVIIPPTSSLHLPPPLGKSHRCMLPAMRKILIEYKVFLESMFPGPLFFVTSTSPPLLAPIACSIRSLQNEQYVNTAPFYTTDLSKSIPSSDLGQCLDWFGLHMPLKHYCKCCCVSHGREACSGTIHKHLAPIVYSAATHFKQPTYRWIS